MTKHELMDIACKVSDSSKCYSRKVGAVLTRNGAIISTGYNGPPTKMRPCTLKDGSPGCPRREMPEYKPGMYLEHCPAAHAERNSILLAAREGICTKGTTIYCYCGLPCKDCMIEIVNAGVDKIVCLTGEPLYDTLSARILQECSISVEYI